MRKLITALLCAFPLTLAIADTEPNNTWQTADLLLQNSSVSGVQSDDDWYVITITSNQTIKLVLIDLKYTDADGDIDIEVYSSSSVGSNGALPGILRDGSDGNTSDHEFVDFNVDTLSPETYYIRILGESRGNGYTLTWGELADTDDAFEPNETISSSQSIAEGAVTLGVQADDDWYSINVRPGNRRIVGSLRFFNNEIATGIDLNLELADASGTIIASSANAPGINESLDHVVPTPGTYHLKIYGDNNGDGYALDWAGMNEAPRAFANTVSTAENTPYHFTVRDFTFTDNEGDSLVSATLSKLSLGGGTLTYGGGTAVNGGDTLTSGQLGTLVYTPPANSSDSPLATFDFIVNDADPGTVAAQMNINVTASTLTALPGSSSGAIAPAWLALLFIAGMFRKNLQIRKGLD